MIGFIVGFVTVGTWSGSWLLGVLAGVVLGVLSVWCFPITRCWWCVLVGGPKKTDRSGRNWRESCWQCGGGGKKRRFLTRFIGGWGLRD